jgi:putative inorganic carbon (HCO3(-)) transporter
MKPAFRNMLLRLFRLTFAFFILAVGTGGVDLNPIGIPFSFGGSLEKLLPWVLLPALGIAFGYGRDFFKRFRLPISLSFAWTAWILAAEFFHVPTKDGTDYLVYFLVGIATFWLTLLSFEDRGFERTLVRLLVFGALITVLRGLHASFLASPDPEHFRVGSRGALRLSTPFGHPNFLGIFLVLVLPFSLSPACLFHTPSRRTPALLVLLNVIPAAGLIFSYSRNAWISALGALSVLLGLAVPKRLGVFLILLLVGANFLLIAGDRVARRRLDHPVWNRIASFTELENDSSITERVHAWKSTLAMIKDVPWLGIGPGNERFQNHYPEYRSPASAILMPHPHNLPLHLAVVFGIPGLLGFMLLTGAGIRKACITLKTASPPATAFARAALASTAGLLLYGLVDSPLFAERVAPVFGLTTAMLFHPGREIRSKSI